MFRLIPREERLFDMFERQAANITESARRLHVNDPIEVISRLRPHRLGRRPGVVPPPVALL